MWRCERKDYSCRARIRTDALTGDMRKNIGGHNHDSNAAKIEVMRTVTALERRSVDTNEATAQVINHMPCHGVSWGGAVNIAISAIAYLFCCFGPTCSVLLRAAIGYLLLLVFHHPLTLSL